MRQKFWRESFTCRPWEGCCRHATKQSAYTNNMFFKYKFSKLTTIISKTSLILKKTNKKDNKIIGSFYSLYDASICILVSISDQSYIV